MSLPQWMPPIHYRCSVANCPSLYYWPADPGFVNKQFYKLPSDEIRRKAWLDILQIPYTISKYSRVCIDHFRDDAFLQGCKKIRLHKFARPFRLRIPEVGENIEVNTTTQIVPSPINTKLNDLNEDCDKEIVHKEATSENNEEIHSTIDADSTATSQSKNQSFADVRKEKKMRRKAKHKKHTDQNKVNVVYKLPSGRKVMFYHLPILNK